MRTTTRKLAAVAVALTVTVLGPTACDNGSEMPSGPTSGDDAGEEDDEQEG